MYLAAVEAEIQEFTTLVINGSYGRDDYNYGYTDYDHDDYDYDDYDD